MIIFNLNVIKQVNKLKYCRNIQAKQLDDAFARFRKHHMEMPDKNIMHIFFLQLSTYFKIFF
jgi:hypothetical protein